MKITKRSQVSSTETIIRLFTEKYNELVKQGTTFKERKYLADFLDEEKKYLEKIKRLPDSVSEEELLKIYNQIT